MGLGKSGESSFSMKVGVRGALWDSDQIKLAFVSLGEWPSAGATLLARHWQCVLSQRGGGGRHLAGLDQGRCQHGPCKGRPPTAENYLAKMSAVLEVRKPAVKRGVSIRTGLEAGGKGRGGCKKAHILSPVLTCPRPVRRKTLTGGAPVRRSLGCGSIF